MLQPVIDALLKPVLAWMAAHPGAVLLLASAYYVGMNAIAAMPEPRQDATERYRFWYTFLHGVAGNLPRVFPGLRFPRKSDNPTPGAQQ